MATSKGVTQTETRLLGQGVSQGFLESQRSQGGTANGINFDPQDYSKTLSAWNNSGNKQFNDKTTGINSRLTDLTNKQDALLGNKFSWNAKEYLPGIQNEANSIYNPQQAEIDAMRQMNQLTAKQTKVETMEQFDNRLQAEIEAINSRGAYFSGGAIQNEQNIRTEQDRALNKLSLSTQMQDYSLQTQQALLGAEKAKYVKDMLIDNQASAYNQWFNERGFQFGALGEMYGQLVDERNFARGVFEDDRNFAQGVEEFQKNYDLSVKQYKLAKKRYKDTKSQYGETLAWQKFKYFDAKKKKKSSSPGKPSPKKPSDGGGGFNF